MAVVGHIEWVDFVPVPRLPEAGAVIHAEGAFARAAGGGGVVARVLAEHGHEVDFFCALGEDELGRASFDELGAAGVRMHVAWRSEPTRRAVTLLGPGGERSIVTIYRRLDPLGVDGLPWDRLGAVDGVYVTAGDADALERARAAPVLVASPRARHALRAADVAVDALVFSDEDADESRWAGEAAARVRLFVATQGAHGGRWWGEPGEGRWEPAPPPGEPRDTYGCGDSFAAGFTVGLASGGSPADAARLGAEWGAIALTRRGAP